MRTKVLLAALGLAGATMLVGPALASGQGPRTDAASGGGQGGVSLAIEFDFDVSSGPSGESPSGSGSFFDRAANFRLTFSEISCLSVSGNTATFYGPLSDPAGFFGKVIVTDNDATGDIFGIALYTTPPTCTPDFAGANASSGIGPITSGDIVVQDAPPLPTSKDQCKNGGWQDFGTMFKNQGDCVSFVAPGGNPPAGTKP
jgi:hypothetical protein